MSTPGIDPKLSGQSDPIDLTGDSDADVPVDSEDEQLRQAIALSLQEHDDSLAQSVKADLQRDSKPSHRTGGLLGLNRKQMEEERLARLKRRREEISPPQVKRRARSLLKTEAMVSSAPSSPLISSNSKPSCLPTLMFPTPAIRQTWCFGHRRRDPPTDIKLEELLDRTNLQACVLSSFTWSFDWLFSKFDTKRTKFLLVMQAKGVEQRRQIEQDWAGIPNVRLCFPSMEGQVHCMHSKLMLLFFETHLRVVVPTANLLKSDWGEEGGVMENTVFVVDLPKANDTEGERVRTAFYDDMLYFLKAQDIPEDVIRKLGKFDWSSTAKVAFVHSIGGAHSGNAWKLTGLCGLGRSVASLGLRMAQEIQLDFVTSSVGSLNDEFMRSIYLAAQGDDGLTEYTLRQQKKLATSIDGGDDRSGTKSTRSAWMENFTFYFPSDKTVKESRGGPEKAGTICFSERWWDSSKFPRGNMRDCLSRREKLLMHNKILFVRFKSPVLTAEGEQISGWVYVGSANLSESAWGRLVQDKSTKSPKLNCRNWECGVIVPLTHETANSSQTTFPLDGGLETFEKLLPVPMKHPAPTYNGIRPWFFED